MDIGLTQADNYQAEISEFRRDKSAFNNHLDNDGFNFVSFKSDAYGYASQIARLELRN